ncbi:hypothetical protein [Acidicapsa acidisoli]|uniref:hypothetical protein n=1 Tax=Acidicapsa acidisoli TaxID=1615681 RepID=UPI0021E07E4A|nr:hypothetical protein [Acidicapsa acidisoli]
MNGLLKKLTFAAPIVAVVLTLTPIAAQAQEIFPIEGGRTTVTLSKAFLADVTAIKATPTSIVPSQLYNNQIFFPITSGAISLDTATGQILHSGGITLTAGTKVVRLDSFILNTLGEQPYVTALVVANGRFLGRINVFDAELSSDLKLPLVPEDGDFFLSGTKLTLDPAGAAALNDAFGVKTFEDNLYIGYALSLVFVPLNADGI